MIIKAVKFRKDGFYTQPFVFGGEEGMERFDKTVRYRGSLQNYLIDTGDEVILVDTGLPATPPSTTAQRSRIFRTTGDARAANSRRRSSIRPDPDPVPRFCICIKKARSDRAFFVI